MSAKLLNRARMTTATTGTGTVTLGSAVTGYATFAEAGAVNATTYTYVAEDTNDFEIGRGTYTSAGTTFSRDTVLLSKIGGVAGTSKINLSGNATFSITAVAEDWREAAITSGSIAGITDLAVADGGTGASSAASAATNLGLGTASAVQHASIALSSASTDQITATRTAATASVRMGLFRAIQTSPANNDDAYFEYYLQDNGAADQLVGRFKWKLTDVTAGAENGKLLFEVTTAGATAAELELTGTALSPVTNDGLALGTASLGYADAFFATGAVLKFNNTDTITHSAGLFTFSTPLSLGTSNALTCGSVELGHASDTTVTRASAGVMAVEGNNVLTTATGIGQGVHTIWVPAAAMVARTTNGAATGTTELATNDVMLKTFDFDQTTEEGVQFMVGMPKSWDESTVTFIPYWTAASGTGGVVFQLAGIAFSNDDAMDTAYGTGQNSTDTLITTNDCHIGPESSAITIAGTPAENDLVSFLITREVADGSDTLNADAKLIGVKLIVSYNAATDA